MSEYIFCNSCGGQNEKESEYCSNCGNKLVHIDPQIKEAHSTQEQIAPVTFDTLPSDSPFNELIQPQGKRVKNYQAIIVIISIAVFFDLIFTLLLIYDVFPYVLFSNAHIIIAQMVLIAASVFSNFCALNNLINDKANRINHIRYFIVSIISFLLPAFLFMLTYTI
ncbi:MAG: hypothetical protein ACTSO7_16650 [Candidatus Heimdallarchaeota archaeon]